MHTCDSPQQGYSGPLCHFLLSILVLSLALSIHSFGHPLIQFIYLFSKTLSSVFNVRGTGKQG